MKKQTVILLALLFSFLTVSAQDSYIKNRWNIKAGYASYPGYFVSSHGMRNNFGNIRLETNYGLFNFLEVGGHLGYSQFSALLPIVGQGLIYKNLNAPYFGLNVNFHPLGFLIKKRDFRFDLYLFGRYGGYYYATPETYVPPKGFYSEIRHGAGLAFYLTKHIGLYAEGSFSKSETKLWNVRGGLTFKF